MLNRIAITIALGLAFVLPAVAQEGEGPRPKNDFQREFFKHMRDGCEDPSCEQCEPKREEENKLDPVAAMEKITELMQLAEEELFDASRKKAEGDQGRAIEKLEELTEENSDNPASEALAKAQAFMKKAQRSQQDSLDTLNKLIEEAKKSGGGG